MKKTNKSQGFTLIELLIVVAIVAIISAVAYPSYQDSVLKSRRSEALADLINMQLEQENFRMINTAYANAFGAGSNDVKQPVSDYYNYKITDTTATNYTLTATAKSTQLKDSGCLEMTLNEAGNKTPATCW